jgi:antitoxin component of RelBE/YafQ-DinJ toxin-antitoxin module
MKSTHGVTIEDALWEKAVKAADEMGTSVSQLCEIALMAAVDRKALTGHIGVLVKTLFDVEARKLQKVTVKQT